MSSEGLLWQGASLAFPAALASGVRSGRKGLGLTLKRELSPVTLFPAQGPASSLHFVLLTFAKVSLLGVLPCTVVWLSCSQGDPGGG